MKRSQNVFEDFRKGKERELLGEEGLVHATDGTRLGRTQIRTWHFVNDSIDVTQARHWIASPHKPHLLVPHSRVSDVVCKEESASIHEL